MGNYYSCKKSSPTPYPLQTDDRQTDDNHDKKPIFKLTAYRSAQKLWLM